jgi:tRNA1Val (adenine37-N6)-methyltransferase
MAKGEFTFKQFVIRQDKCAMKVCTDACIMGASIPIMDRVENILDIGSGTGILSLMIAQRSNASIDAVEVNSLAANQCKENVLLSPWKDRIRVHEQSIQEFAKSHHKKYDLIICNPPFFQNNLPSSDPDYNIACHSELLTFEELVQISARFLHGEGMLVIMLPEQESLLLQKIANQSDLSFLSSTNIRHDESSRIIRRINYFGINTHHQLKEEEISIKNKQGMYSLQFRQLLQSYYTIF